VGKLRCCRKVVGNRHQLQAQQCRIQPLGYPYCTRIEGELALVIVFNLEPREQVVGRHILTDRVPCQQRDHDTREHSAGQHEEWTAITLPPRFVS